MAWEREGARDARLPRDRLSTYSKHYKNVQRNRNVGILHEQFKRLHSKGGKERRIWCKLYILLF